MRMYVSPKLPQLSLHLTSVLPERILRLTEFALAVALDSFQLFRPFIPFQRLARVFTTATTDSSFPTGYHCSVPVFRLRNLQSSGLRQQPKPAEDPPALCCSDKKCDSNSQPQHWNASRESPIIDLAWYDAGRPSLVGAPSSLKPPSWHVLRHWPPCLLRHTKLASIAMFLVRLAYR